MVDITHVLLNMVKNPSGTDGMPRVSWQLKADGENLYQKFYEIQVAEDKNFVYMTADTGKVMSEQSVHVCAGEIILKPLQKYYVRVRAGLNDGRESGFSLPQWFITAPCSENLKGSFITAEMQEDADNAQGTAVKKQFHINKKIKNAYVCASALGLYYLYINGKRVSGDCLCPGWTNYKKRLLYQIYDVTDILKMGDNEFQALLGAGWYKGTIGFYEKRNNYGRHTAFWFQLKIVYDDGAEEIVCTDGTWQGAYSNVKFSEIYDGEIYDASAGPPLWREVKSIDYPLWRLCPQEGCKVRVHEKIKPKKLFYTPKGELCADFGQNMAGWVKIHVKASRGQRCCLRFFEVLDQDGNAYFDNLRDAKQQDCYICGGGEESYEPMFTFHGFRYVKIEEWPGEVTKDMLTACAVYSEMEQIGKFSCSDSLVNQLVHNILWGMKSNFLDIPMDCPQRDERLGWTGDAQIFSGTAAGLMNVCAFFRKWLADIASEQYENGGIPHVVPDVITGRVSKGDLFEQGTDSASGWADAAVIIPWQMYLAFGDTQIIRRQFSSMKAWLHFLELHSENYEFRYKLQFGDWVALDAYEGSYFGATPVELTSMAYYAYVTELFSKMAEAVGKLTEAKAAKKLHSNIREAFVRKYFKADGTMTVMTQTAHVLALHFKLVPEEYREKTIGNLVKLIEKEGGHLVTGFMGTPYICFALSDNGCGRQAYELLLKKDFPSWLYQVRKGATTVWEHWDGIKDDKTMWSAEMNSFNHYAYGAVGEWLFKRAAGLVSSEKAPGYKQFTVCPEFCSPFSYVDYKYRSVYGNIRVRWEKNGEKGRLFVHVPVNTTAWLRLSVLQVTSKGGLLFYKKDGLWETQAGSGDYEIIFLL